MGQHLISELPEILELGPLQVPRDQMIAFSERFDPQPFHLDDKAAADTLLGGLSASAWYVCSKIDGLLRRQLASRGLALEVVGAEQIVLLAPVRAGDTLTATARFWALTDCRCGDLGGGWALEVTNQNGHCVARMTLECLINARAQTRQGRYDLCGFRHGRQARAERRHRVDVVRFFDDIEIGDEIDLGEYRFGHAEVADYEQRVGPEGDEQASAFSREYVPSWHLPAAWMQCMVKYYEREAFRLQSCEQPVPRLGPAAGIKQLRWHRPVAIGETIAFRGWAERKISIRSQKHWGLLVVGAEGVDANGKLVVSFYPQMLLERAPLPPA
jgi:acyl dehydratase